MKKSLDYSHLVDLEYFFHQDSRLDPEELRRRDRAILLTLEQDRPGSLATEQSGDGPALLRIRGWVESRVASEFSGPQEKSPGEVVDDVLQAGRGVTGVAGLVTGITGGLAFFTYSGTTPVNVFTFLLLFVFSQFALVALLFMTFCARRLLARLPKPSFYCRMFARLLNRLLTTLHRGWLRNLPADRRTSAAHAFGLLKAQSSSYGSLFYWPLFNLSQIFGVCCNIGLLAITLVKVTTSDLAFGWQSTLQFSNQAILKMVELLSWPWSWFFADGGHPGLEEIAGSRIVLKDGIYHLSTVDLVAWWPFLVLCLLFYGLLLRTLLLVMGAWMARSQLGRFSPDSANCVALLRRMNSPLLSSQAATEEHVNTESVPVAGRVEIRPRGTDHLAPQVVFIADDIFDLCGASELAMVLGPYGLSIGSMHRFQISYEEDQQLLEDLASRHWQEDEGLCIVMEGWMVPLTGFLTYIKELRAILPEKRIITVALTGRPAETVFTPVRKEDVKIWKAKLEAGGDPCLQLLTLSA